jgi:large subunit ribosomal protein L18
MRSELIKRARHARRIRRVRKKVIGIGDRPRLAVSRSNRHIYAQVIDDLSGKTLCGVSSQSKDLQGELGAGGGNKAAAVIVGKTVAEKAKALGVEKVSFDRRGRKYHGRVKALADAAREAGLKF